MSPRDPLTERYLHETREINPDPKAWIEGPHHADPWHRPSPRWLGLVLMLASTAVAVAVGAVLWKAWNYFTQ
jgi:hypothetical protein